MVEDEYELLPQKDILKLKKEIQTLRGKAPPEYKEEQKFDRILESMTVLSESIENLNSIFKATAEEMKLEEKNEDIFMKKLEPLFRKVDMLVEQNEKIAKGMIAVADIANELKSRIEDIEHGKKVKPPEERQRPVMSPMSMPDIPPPRQRAIPPMPPMPRRAPSARMPPPPPPGSWLGPEPMMPPPPIDINIAPPTPDKKKGGGFLGKFIKIKK